MEEEVITALIAAVVSIIVSLVGAVSSWLVIRAKNKELERNIRSLYMQKLYDLRLQNYPKAFEITRGLTLPPKNWKSYDRDFLFKRREALHDWLNGPSGLIISKTVMVAAYKFSKCLCSNYGETGQYTKLQMEKLIASAISLRRELRADIQFMHMSDTTRQLTTNDSVDEM